MCIQFPSNCTSEMMMIGSRISKCLQHNMYTKTYLHVNIYIYICMFMCVQVLSRATVGYLPLSSDHDSRYPEEK